MHRWSRIKLVLVMVMGVGYALQGANVILLISQYSSISDLQRAHDPFASLVFLSFPEMKMPSEKTRIWIVCTCPRKIAKMRAEEGSKRRRGETSVLVSM